MKCFPSHSGKETKKEANINNFEKCRPIKIKAFTQIKFNFP